MTDVSRFEAEWPKKKCAKFVRPCDLLQIGPKVAVVPNGYIGPTATCLFLNFSIFSLYINIFLAI